SIELQRESGNAPITRGEAIATYILLANFTDQVIRKVKDSLADAFVTSTAVSSWATETRPAARRGLGRKQSGVDRANYRHRETDEIGPTSDIGRPRQTASRSYSRSDTR